jgi:fermentation-respiration switch protein FrsA (DUF1100 family)
MDFLQRIASRHKDYRCAVSEKLRNNIELHIRPWYWRISASTARIAVICYIAFCLLLIAMESRLVYQPPVPRDGTLDAKSFGAQEVWFTSEDQTKLHGWFFPADNTTRSIVFFHGNGEDAEYNLNWAAELRARFKAAVFVFDYRGYGHSGGSAFESGVVMDGVAAQRWMAERMNCPTSNIILYGRSLGGGVAIAAAAQLGAKAVIVENTFANMVEVAASKYSYVPVRTLMRNSYLSQERILNYQGPFIQFHGADDVLVPIALARPLCESAPTKNKQFVEVPGCGHNDPLPEYCYTLLAEFLDSLPGESSSRG